MSDKPVEHIFQFNKVNILVIDFPLPEVSQAILPKCYGWENTLPLLTEENQADYWREDFLKEQLNRLKNNRLVTRPLPEGWLYVWCDGYLTAEFQIKAPQGNATLPSYHAVDLTEQQGKDQRVSEEQGSPLLELVYGGQSEHQKYQLAYSEYQWPWLLINNYGGMKWECPSHDHPHYHGMEEELHPQLLAPRDDRRIIKTNNLIADSLRPTRFLDVSSFATPLNEDDEPDPALKEVSRYLPKETLERYSELATTPDFHYPYKEFREVWLPHGASLTASLVNDFHTAQQGLYSLMSALNDTDTKKQYPNLFPFGEHTETAMLASQLYFSTPNVPTAKTLWERDNSLSKFTDKLAYDDVRNALKSIERSLYRDIQQALQSQLLTLLSNQQTNRKEWSLEGYSSPISSQLFHQQLIAWLQDFRACPLQPAVTESDDEQSAVIIPSAHLRWQTVSEMLYPMTQDVNIAGLLFSGEPEYSDYYYDKNHSRSSGFETKREALIESILNQQHPFADLCFIEKLEPRYQWETHLKNVASLSDDVENEAQAQQERQALWDAWMAVATHNQNKEITKPKELPITAEEIQLGYGWGLLIPKSILTFVNCFPKFDKLANVQRFVSLVNSLTPLSVQALRYADAFENLKDVPNVRTGRVQLISDFLQHFSEEIERDTARYQDGVESTLSKRNRKGRARHYQRVMTTSSELEYQEAIKKYRSKKRVILSPDASTLWQSTLDQGYHGVRLKGGVDAKTIQGQALQSATLHLQIAGFASALELFNFYFAANKIKTNIKAKEESRQVIELVGAVAGSLNAFHDLAAKYQTLTKQLPAAQQLGGQSGVLGKMTTALAGTDKGWRLGRHAVGAKYLPLIGGLIALTFSGKGFSKALHEGDDAAVAHLLGVGSAVAGLGALFFGSMAFLGPVGFVLAGLAFALQKTVFKQDNLLDEWLDHGPFSRANTNFLRLTPIPVISWNPDKHPLQQGIKNNLPNAGSVLLCDTNEAYCQIVFNLNYQFIGLNYSGGIQSFDEKQIAYQVSQLPWTLKAKDGVQQLFYSAQYAMKEGDQVGESATQCRQIMSQIYQKLKPELDTIDESKRGVDDFLDVDDAKFVSPMAQRPISAFEALLNAAFPLGIKAHMYPADPGHTNRRGSTFGQSGNNVQAVIDVPYFIEGQSKLLVEFREGRNFSTQDRYNQIPIPVTSDHEYRLTIDSMENLESYKEEHQYLEADTPDYRLYSSSNNGIKQIVIVANLRLSEVDTLKDDEVKTGGLAGNVLSRVTDIEVWARLSVNGTKENEQTVDKNADGLPALWMPFRQASSWDDFDKVFPEKPDILFLKNGLLKKRSQYVSPDQDWIVSEAAGTARS